MHKLTIVFGPTGTVWPLLFKTEEAVDAAVEKARTYKEGSFCVIDDFSQHVSIPEKEIRGVMIEDLEVSKLAHIEHQMYVWRVQAMAQQSAAGDPVLRAAAQRQGPAVITPQGANGFGRPGF